MPPRSKPSLSEAKRRVDRSSSAHHATAPEAEPLAPGPDAVRADALLPEQLLQPGEIIILLLKPHPLFIVLAPLATLVMMVLVVGGGVYIARSAGAYDTAQNIALIGGLLIAARLLWQFLEWLSRVYVITDQRVVALGGVLRVRVFEAPLQSITHSELLFSLRERVFALGTLGFYTAGSSIGEAYWLMVARPLEVHRKVVETLKRYRR
jgi:uncharacterized membrane protein YdbT with pleckstrin-like domain